MNRSPWGDEYPVLRGVHVPCQMQIQRAPAAALSVSQLIELTSLAGWLAGGQRGLMSFSPTDFSSARVTQAAGARSKADCCPRGR